jgi:DNA-binding Lrp family transcriptional regulator
MPAAYILINSELGLEESVIEEVRKMPEVVEVSGIFGVYDIIVKLESGTMESLKEVITWKIRSTPGVKSTLTLLKIEGQGEGRRVSKQMKFASAH